MGSMKLENVVRLILTRENNGSRDVLLGKRSLTKRYPGLWEYPGGKVDPGEDLLTAATRESQEEIGTEQETGSKIFIQYPPIAVQIERSQEYDKEYMVAYFLATTSDKCNPQLKEPTKTSEWKWFDVNKLPKPEEMMSSQSPMQMNFRRTTDKIIGPYF